jgi:hypothetical protein
MTATASQESTRAAEAFAIYTAMGPGRSLTALAHVLVERNWYKTVPTARSVVGGWSAKHRWQERLAAAITAQTEEMLAKAVEIDARSFLRTSELIAKRLGYAEPEHLDAIIKMRESVRKPEPRGNSQTINVNLSVTLRAIVERVASERGLEYEEVLAEAERTLREGR